jgi:lambda family phage portal protein
MEQYDRAELVRKGLAAMMAFFERDVDGNASALLAEGGETEDDVPIQGIQPGSFIRLPVGKTIESPQFSDLDGMYAVFTTWQLRKTAAGLGVTYEQLTGDWEKVTYSSARAALLEFRRRCEAFQHLVMVYQFCRPVLKAFCDAAAIAGVIDPRDYVLRPRAYLDVEWSPPKWPWVDPLKDIQAEILAVDNLLKSRSQVIKETNGADRETVDAEIQADQQSETQKGLKRNTSKAAVPQTDSQQGGQGAAAQ